MLIGVSPKPQAAVRQAAIVQHTPTQAHIRQADSPKSSAYPRTAGPRKQKASERVQANQTHSKPAHDDPFPQTVDRGIWLGPILRSREA
ncbi:hypothetical protein AAFF_G00253330 [Aldrovandia affinis]|uniref:Uncharacterized protein n=1 Tax=Aldrovandia affinis TaxID=143900 RepID=A0AAD7SU26_9TELE|nr:hypothetical protein AAFF_G00253330 [Aldrovandia affinis]